MGSGFCSSCKHSDLPSPQPCAHRTRPSALLLVQHIKHADSHELCMQQLEDGEGKDSATPKPAGTQLLALPMPAVGVGSATDHALDHCAPIARPCGAACTLHGAPGSGPEAAAAAAAGKPASSLPMCEGMCCRAHAMTTRYCIKPCTSVWGLHA